MYSHVTIGSNDLHRAAAFYDTVLATLGIERRMTREGALLGYQGEGRDRFFVVRPFDGNPATVGNGVHVAFAAPSRAQVDAFHAAALANGGTDEGQPGSRPHYHEHYYGAYVRDPEGNKLQATCHMPEQAAG